MTEHQEQVRVCQYLDYLQILHFSIPNGIFLKDRTTAYKIMNKMKAEGLKSGVPDLFIPESKHNYNGLFLEMKSKKGVMGEKQKAWREKLIQKKYKVEVCKGFENAKKIIDDYFNLGGKTI